MKRGGGVEGRGEIRVKVPSRVGISEFDIWTLCGGGGSRPW